MNEPQSRSSLREVVLEKIKRGEVTMRPKWQFMLKGALVVLGVMLLTLTLLYLVSFVFFALRQTGVWFAPSFGWRGMRAFFIGIPWLLVLLSLVFITVLEILVKRYAFAYRKPLLYSVLGIVLLVFIGGFVVAKTTFHRGMYRRMEGRGLPIAGPLYRAYGVPHFKQIHPGVISSTTDQGFILANQRGESITIIVTPATRLPLGFDFIEGDQVVVFGLRDDDYVQALGVREVNEEFMRGVPMRGGHRAMPPPWLSPVPRE